MLAINQTVTTIAQFNPRKFVVETLLKFWIGWLVRMYPRFPFGIAWEMWLEFIMEFHLELSLECHLVFHLKDRLQIILKHYLEFHY